MDKIKGSKIKIIGSIIIVLGLVVGGNWIYKNRKVHFEDEKMRQVICLELGKDKDSQDVTYRDLETIEELEIGPVGNFKTIEDVAKCKNLKELWINIEITDEDASYIVYKKTDEGRIYLPIVEAQKAKKVQADLEKIFKEAREIERFGFSNFNGSCNIRNFNFLKYAENLKEIDIAYGNVFDYLVLKNCSELEDIDLWKSNIETADALLKLKHAKKFILTGTPLAENEEELNRLRETFPEAKIIVN